MSTESNPQCSSSQQQLYCYFWFEVDSYTIDFKSKMKAPEVHASVMYAINNWHGACVYMRVCLQLAICMYTCMPMSRWLLDRGSRVRLAQSQDWTVHWFICLYTFLAWFVDTFLRGFKGHHSHAQDWGQGHHDCVWLLHSAIIIMHSCML